MTSLGPGQRVGIWFQGCSIGCAGCVSRDTWVSDEQHDTTVAEVLQAVEELTDGSPDGVTISGGEPFEQPEALLELLQAIRSWPVSVNRTADVLVYSGMPLEVLEERYSAIVALVDVLITDPYVAANSSDDGLRGSANQRVTIRTQLGASRFEGAQLSGIPGPRRIQVSVDEKNIWMIGIPRRGDLLAVERAALQRGVAIGRVSWRA